MKDGLGNKKDSSYNADSNVLTYLKAGQSTPFSFGYSPAAPTSRR